jgi:succinate-semialdehyde dehydrogenase/glutarate-semialdehyde dehydrogenase
VSIRNQLYINGEWMDGNGKVPVYDPSNGQVITEVATAGDLECDAAIRAAHEAFPLWSKTAPRIRAEII